MLHQEIWMFKNKNSFLPQPVSPRQQSKAHKRSKSISSYYRKKTTSPKTIDISSSGLVSLPPIQKPRHSKQSTTFALRKQINEY